ncbi:hypothetical protein BS78_05G090100 [Paspalum vaginatum]|nr:hypothetical protein BS78_05G090100 [Paspalum vaginatum]
MGPALYRAVCKGSATKVMHQLQQHGCAPNDEATGGILKVVSAGRNTVLHLAAEKGHYELIRELYAKYRVRGEDLLTWLNSADETPLHCAARSGSRKAVRVIVDELSNQEQDHRSDSVERVLTCRNKAGDTALHLAARHGHGKVIEVLVSVPSTVTAQLNNAGVSPLYLAVMSGSVDAVKAIIDCDHPSVASFDGPASQNALHAAVFKSKDMVDLLLKWKPALADDEDDESGSSPLHFASSDGDWKIVEAILNAAPTTVYKKDKKGLSALHIATKMGHLTVVKKLLKRCPDAAELRDKDGRTFLHTAAMKNRLSVVSYAIKKFKPPGLLDAALDAGGMKCFKAHALLDALDSEGNTALHLAVEAGAPQVVEALLRNGKVQTDIPNNKGLTPFDLTAKSASFFTMVTLVVMLVAFGAQTQPQRQDLVEPWDKSKISNAIEKTSDSLAVVSVLVAAAALAAGFNLPGGYNNDGMANIMDEPAFKTFMFLDILAVVAAVVAVILLVYGKATCHAGSWKSFVASLHCIWVSLLSLMLALNAASLITAGTADLPIKVTRLSIQILIIWMMTWVAPATKSSLTNLRFMWRRFGSRGRHVIKRQYPLASAAITNLLIFMFTNLMASIGYIVLWALQLNKDMAPSPAPSPALL